jgi:citrate lyase subunit beta / citryl-CoA lyase
VPISRSHLYVPGDRATVIAGAGRRGADAIILDLEDAVAPTQKTQARSTVAAAIAAGIEGAREIWVRVNSPSVAAGEFVVTDLEAVALPGLSGIVVAKVESVEEIEFVTETLERLELGRALPTPLKVAVLIESALGLQRCEEIAAAKRVSRIGLGETDLGASLGLDVSDNEAELLPIRSRIVVAAAAAGIEPPVASVFTEITNLTRLRTTTERLRRLGFIGRAAIHPSQVEIIHAVFTPSKEQLGNAERLVASFDTARSLGTGVLVGDDGRMIDEAVVRSARLLLEIQRDA